MLIRGLTVKGIEVRSTSSAISSDEYFNLVSLLLPGTGTNGAQNNTFVDGSTNNFTVTRAGNTTQGTFSPFSQTGWSGYFDGSGDYLSLPSSTSLDLGTSDFTIEAFVFNSSTEALFPYIGSCSSPSGITQFGFLNSGNTVTRVILGNIDYPPSNNSTLLKGSSSFAVGTWAHVAYVRSSGTITIYLNGTSVGTVSDSRGSVQQLRSVGGTYSTYFAGLFFEWLGNISNLRFVKGTAVYTSAFTPPTAPLTAISGTSLLTCQSNRFVDNSSNAFAITVNGNTSVQAFAPFDPTTAYSAGAVGGSGYFDGTGDSLRKSGSGVLTASGDVTIECWMYPATSSVIGLFDGGPNEVSIIRNWQANIIAKVFSEATGAVFTPIANQWQHFAVTLSAGNITVYINGAVSGTGTYTSGYAAGSNFDIGAINGGGDGAYNGYISNFRVTKSLVYTSAFTPPTAPLTAVANTSLLLNFTNGGITDVTAKNVLETVGGAAISTAQSKFGGSSMAFDGTGDWLFTKTSPNLDMGTGDVTIEGWFYLTATVAVDYRMIVSDATNGNNYLCIRAGGTGGQVEVNVNGTSFRLNLNNSVSINTWFHLAVSRSSGTWYGFVNGNSIGTSSGAGAFNLGNGGMYVGRFGGGTAYEWPGYINDLRITKGLARYTTTFTPPTQAFPTQ
jgi:hypothetical protein